jgi:hypothetical protein
MVSSLRTIFPQINSLTTIIVLIIGVVGAGCIQPAERPVAAPVTPGEQISSPSATTLTVTQVSVIAKTKSVTAFAQKPDATKILVTFSGGPDADQLMEIETTVTDSKRTIRTQSMGSRLGTTPVQTGGKNIFYGPYAEKAHVSIIGYFADGTHQDILDTWI